MASLEWLAQPASRLLSLSLLHFLWQGLAISLVLVAIVELCNVRRATTRYACSLVALLAMTICPLATFAWLAIEISSTPLHSPLPRQLLDSLQKPHWLNVAQPYALCVWLGGVFLFGSRLLAGAAGISRLRRGRLPLPPKMTAIVDRLGERMHIDALPLVYLSKQAADAMAVGLIRPLVLIPAAWVSEMPLPMLEAVIAHELAHLARRDLWVNLLQRIVETLLFYHPAVWWLSRRLRIERELCADELAVAATGDPMTYAQALEHIAGERQADIRPALAAFLRGETDMRLLERVRNVLGQPSGERSRLWPAGIVALALPLGLWAAAAISGVAVADDDDDNERKKPTIKRQREEGAEERRVTILKKVPRDEANVEVELVEERVIKRDGKPIVETQLGLELRDDQGHRRIDELTALVKRLAGQVERLQDEVSQLRSQKVGSKEALEREESLTRSRQWSREDVEASKREIRQAAEKIETAQRALAEKQKAIAELAAKQARQAGQDNGRAKEVARKLAVETKEEKAAQAALEKAEAAREKAEAAREKAELIPSIEEKIRKLKERDAEPDEIKALLRTLLDEKVLLKSPGDKPTIKIGK